MSDEHPLRVWRQKRKMTQAALGEVLGIGTSQVSQIETRERGCSLKTALTIHALTKGKVPMDSLISQKAEASQ